MSIERLHTRFIRSPGLLLLVLSCVVVMALHGGPIWSGVGAGFFNGHVWVVSHVAEMLSGSASPETYTMKIGAPEGADLRLIAWVPLIIAAPLSLLLGAPIATWIVTILGFWAAWWVTIKLIQRMSQVNVWVSAGAAATYVFGSFSLGLLANGQLAKLQLWALPLLLLSVDKLIREDGGWLRTAMLVLGASMAMGFTSPSIGLVMPMAVTTWVAVRTPWTRRGLAFGLLGLMLAAVGLLPAYLYHSLPSVGEAGFVPAQPIPGLIPPENLNPVATWKSLVGWDLSWDRSASAINHVGVLGWASIVGGLVAAVRFPRAAATGLSLTFVGIIFALGPEVERQGVRWVLPAAILEEYSYPLSKSGMYYRFTQVAALGLAICMAQLVERIRWLGAVCVVSSLSFGFWVTSDLWPRPIRPIPNAELLALMSDDPLPGAVLEFPLSHIDTEGDHRLLGQIIHQRATSVLPRNIVVRGVPRLERLERLSQSEDAGQALKAEGFRYVILHNPRREQRRFELLSQRLGEPKGNAALAVWTLP